MHKIAVACIFVALGGCQLAQNAKTYATDALGGAPAAQLTADQAAMAAQVKAYDASFKVAALKAGTNALTLGKHACALASELDGLFKLVAPVAIAAGVADPGIGATEAGVFLGAEGACKIIDAINLPADSASVEAAAATAINAVSAIKSSVAAVSPPALAAATASAPLPPASGAVVAPQPVSQ